MSFGPLQNTSDYDIYTKKYLQILQLKVALIQKNFDENVAYMRTGVQETERPDSRSIEERASDVEKLKVQARAMLNKITDATNASEVLDYLVKNGDLLFFFIQQFPSIEEIVKKQFAGGIRAPLLISLIFKRFTTQQEESLLPESDDFAVVSNIMTKEDAETLYNETQSYTFQTLLEKIRDELPSKAEIKRVLDDPVKYLEELKMLAEKYKSSPTIDDYNKMLDEYNDAPIKTDPSNTDLEQQQDYLIEKVNDFLAQTQSQGSPITPISPTILEGTKQYKSRSSLARTIPKAPEEKRKKRISAAERLEMKRLEEEAQQQKVEQMAKKVSTRKIGSAITKKRQREAEAKAKAEAEAKAKAEAEAEAKLKTTAASKIGSFMTKKGRPAGSKNKPKAAVPLPVAPTTPPKAPSSTPSTPIQTGSGLLNEKEQDAHRFKVLKGEIGAGNKSPELIREMKKLLIKLHKGGELSLEQTAGILKELNTLK